MAISTFITQSYTRKSVHEGGVQESIVEVFQAHFRLKSHTNDKWFKIM